MMGLLFTLSSFAAADMQCTPQYQLEVKTETVFDMVSPVPEKLTLKALVSLKPTEYQGVRWWAIKADEVWLQRAGVKVREPSYERAFAFQLDRDGMIKAFWFGGAIAADQQEKLKGLAYYFQYQRTEQSQTRVEQDALGRYRIRYQTEKGALKMTKLAYQLNAESRGSAFKQVEIDHSEHKVVPSSCWFKTRTGQEALQFAGHSEVLNFRSQQQYQLSLSQAVFDSVLFQLPVQLTQWPTAQQASLSDQELARLTRELQTFLTHQDLTQLDGYSLAQQLRRFDEVLLTLSTFWSELQLSDKAQMRLFNALGQLDSPHSQQLLVGFVADQSRDRKMRFRAMRAIAAGQQPLSKNAWQTIEEILLEPSAVGEQRSEFIMTLGAMLERRESNQYSQALAESLRSTLANSTDEREMKSVITAMGNSRDPEFVDAVLMHRDSRRSGVRKAVARALGRFDNPQAYQGLVVMLGRKDPHSVQSSVLQSLASYPLQESVREHVFRYAQRSEDESVRYAAVQAIAAQQYPEREKQLRALLAAESSKRNFTAIVKALHQ